MPQPSFNIRGDRRTGEFRVRPIAYGCIMEELIENRDGSKRWVKIRWPVNVEIVAKPNT